MNKIGELIIQSTVYRTQEHNLADAIKRLENFIKEAEIVPKERVKIEGRTERGDRERLIEKKMHSEKKSLRREKNSKKYDF
jgi:hypothetical protein